MCLWHSTACSRLIATFARGISVYNSNTSDWLVLTPYSSARPARTCKVRCKSMEASSGTDGDAREDASKSIADASVTDDAAENPVIAARKATDDQGKCPSHALQGSAGLESARKVDGCHLMHVYMPAVWLVCSLLRSTDEERLQRMAGAVRTLLECMVGPEDVEREGLRATPMRMAKALLYFTKGYKQSLEVSHEEQANRR